jgi:hypothetical protein
MRLDRTGTRYYSTAQMAVSRGRGTESVLPNVRPGRGGGVVPRRRWDCLCGAWPHRVIVWQCHAALHGNGGDKIPRTGTHTLALRESRIRKSSCPSASMRWGGVLIASVAMYTIAPGRKGSTVAYVMARRHRHRHRLACLIWTIPLSRSRSATARNPSIPSFVPCRNTTAGMPRRRLGIDSRQRDCSLTGAACPPLSVRTSRSRRRRAQE